MEKIFYSVKEVAEMFDINASNLRYWEKEFASFLRPKRTKGDTRQYRKEDIDIIRRIHYLLKEQGLTIAGAKQRLKDNKEDVVNTEDVVFRLKNIRADLQSLEKEFEELEKQMQGN
jgi:DNA-binding transcriptional MerR regulator